MQYFSPEGELPHPPANSEKSLNKLLDIVTTLRSKNGCPWDIKQTPGTIKKYLIEECGELAEAISTGSSRDICEEIGDLFYILSMLIIMFEEKEDFSRNDVLDEICEKMIRRHPHVFADAKLSSDRELREQWQQIKNSEKNHTTK